MAFRMRLRVCDKIFGVRYRVYDIESLASTTADVDAHGCHDRITYSKTKAIYSKYMIKMHLIVNNVLC